MIWHPIDRQNGLDRLARLAKEAAREREAYALDEKLAEINELANKLRCKGRPE